MCDVLYHYCSNDSFLKIIQSKKLRLSSLRLSNDYLEGKWLLEILQKICDESGLSSRDNKRLMSRIIRFIEIIDGLGFCLSESRDQLSQWRGYAHDANGICVGFSKEKLTHLSNETHVRTQLSVNLKKIIYEPKEQEAHIKDRFMLLLEAVEEGAYVMKGKAGLLDSRSKEDILKDDVKIDESIAREALAVTLILLESFFYKNPAFSEEKEWRILSLFNDFIKGKVQYEAAPNSIKPVRYLSFESLKSSFVREVVLGPKNMSSIITIEKMMSSYGYDNVKVSRSAASYR